MTDLFAPAPGSLSHAEERALYERDTDAWLRYVQPGIAAAWRRTTEDYRRAVWPTFSEAMRDAVRRAVKNDVEAV